jgi:hypothetical protein
MATSLVPNAAHIMPSLDADFRTAVLANRAFQHEAAKARLPLVIAGRVE